MTNRLAKQPYQFDLTQNAPTRSGRGILYFQQREKPIRTYF